MQALDSRRTNVVLEMTGHRELLVCRDKQAGMKHLCPVRVPDKSLGMHCGMENAPIHIRIPKLAVLLIM